MHPGICRMKALARNYVWWPNIDKDIESKILCDSCQIHRHDPAKEPLHPWEYPSRPWSRIHLDYAGPFLGKMFLIMVDAYSKWIEIHIHSSATTQATIDSMMQAYSTHGLPEQCVSDNATCFTSHEIQGIPGRKWHTSDLGSAASSVVEWPIRKSRPVFQRSHEEIRSWKRFCTKTGVSIPLELSNHSSHKYATLSCGIDDEAKTSNKMGFT